MRFEFCWQQRHCDRRCPVRESESIFCWRIAHRERFCHPQVCHTCEYRRNWFRGEYDLQEFLKAHGGERIRRKAHRVLAVDSEPNFLFALEETILNLGCNCLTAVDGEEGLFFAQQTRPDLVVTSVLLPGLDGLNLCRRLKASTATAGIPIIVVSVLAQARNIEAGMAAGASAYLVKPLHPADLERQIRSLLPTGPPDARSSTDKSGEGGPSPATEAP